ncbi:MAG: thioredoxin family protein [Planctomycetota bacterium]
MSIRFAEQTNNSNPTSRRQKLPQALIVASMVLLSLTGCQSAGIKPPAFFGKTPKFGADRESPFDRMSTNSRSDEQNSSSEPDSSNVRLASHQTPVADATWYQSFDDAQLAAESSGLPMLVLFTGSDWCGWCIRLKDEVLETREFKSWATDNVILVELDFPRKTSLPFEVQARNEELKRRFKVEGFPTVVVLDRNGDSQGKLGYMNDPGKWIAAAEAKLR